jgi:GAF domain-containing protein
MSHLLEKKVEQLTRELSEAQDLLKATSEVLRIISDSPADVALALETIAENAARLLDVTDATIMRVEGEVLRCMANHGPSPQWSVGTTRALSRDWVTGRAVIDRATVHVADLQTAESEFPEGAVYARQFGHRTTLATPLLREGNAIGAILIRRMRARPFTEKQIALVQNFAAQAVIAIENTRLLNELRESLQQQTATADVLKVISSSPGNMEPVFQAMLENATRLCEAKFGTMYFREGDAFRAVAMHGAPPAYMEARLHALVRPGPTTGIGRVVQTKDVVQIEDAAADQGYADRDPMRVSAVELGGIRTLLVVPMLKEKELIGAIAIYREVVRPFTAKQIDLVKNFAAQAVIAIENTRLLNELRQRTDDLSEALEQQTATSEVLKVISGSPGDL